MRLQPSVFFLFFFFSLLNIFLSYFRRSDDLYERFERIYTEGRRVKLDLKKNKKASKRNKKKWKRIRGPIKKMRRIITFTCRPWIETRCFIGSCSKTITAGFVDNDSRCLIQNWIPITVCLKRPNAQWRSGMTTRRLVSFSIRSPDVVIRSNLFLSNATTLGDGSLFRTLRVLELIPIELRVKYTWQYAWRWKVVPVVLAKSLLLVNRTLRGAWVRWQGPWGNVVLIPLTRRAGHKRAQWIQRIGLTWRCRVRYYCDDQEKRAYIATNRSADRIS